MHPQQPGPAVDVRDRGRVGLRRLRAGRPGTAWSRRDPANERGMVTAEISTALPALVAITVGLLFVIGAVGAQLQCGDLSREAVRELARGEDQTTVANDVLAHAPPDARLTVSRTGDLVTATVTAHAPALGGLAARIGAVQVSGSATALDEASIGLAP